MGAEIKTTGLANVVSVKALHVLGTRLEQDQIAETGKDVTPEPSALFCINCGQALALGFNFCPPEHKIEEVAGE